MSYVIEISAKKLNDESSPFIYISNNKNNRIYIEGTEEFNIYKTIITKDKTTSINVGILLSNLDINHGFVLNYFKMNSILNLNNYFDNEVFFGDSIYINNNYNNDNEEGDTEEIIDIKPYLIFLYQLIEENN